ncbi:MAG: hypothetical protein FWD97_04675 [Defluviitaleaceae bacterium]|nr:hypothetical protein [Defluviitaleaceae bacterium]
MGNFLNRFVERSTLVRSLVFTAIFAVFFLLINFSPIGVAGLLEITGGANILDFEVAFTFERAFEVLYALGEDGRHFYLTRILPLDFPFPASVMLFGMGWIGLLLKHINTKERYNLLLLPPVMFALFDWIENVGIIVMLNNFPDLPVWAVWMSSVAGVIKYVSVPITLGVIAVLFVIFCIRRKKEA